MAQRFYGNPDGLGFDVTEKSQEKLIRLNDIRKRSVLPVLAFKKDFEEADGEKKSRLIYEFLIKNGVTERLREKLNTSFRLVIPFSVRSRIQFGQRLWICSAKWRRR